MSLIYLVTRLPKLTLGEPPPIQLEDLVRQARASLEGENLEELERALLLEEVEETVRVLHRARLAVEAGERVELPTFARTERARTGLDRAVRDLPDWVLDPVPQHVLLRRYYQHLVTDTKSEPLRAYAKLVVNIEEASTALRCEREQLTRPAFLAQMSGHFDSSARVIVDSIGQPDFGIGQRFAWWPRLVAALAAEDRVEGERALDRERFAAIDTLEGTATFSVEAVLAAYYRLRIIAREASWDRKAGLATLDRILTIETLEKAIGRAS